MIPCEYTRALVLRAIGLTALVGAVVGTGVAVAIQGRQPWSLDAGDVEIVVAPAIRTGHQRAERLAFDPEGTTLAVTCPRYDRVVVYRLGAGESPVEVADIRTEGMPVAVQTTSDRLHVLQRPRGDARHLEPGWVEAFDLDGRVVGSRFRVGWDPDDLAVLDDGRTLLVILSGHAEGESNRPDPSLVVVDLADVDHPRLRARLVFDQPGDNPERLAIATNADGNGPERAAVSLRGSGQVAWIDLSDRDHPRLLQRARLPEGGQPGPLTFDDRGALLATDVRSGATWAFDDLETHPAEGEAARAPRRVSWGAGIGDLAAINPAGAADRAFLVATLPNESALAVLDPAQARVVRVPLAGGLGFGTVIPVGLASTRDARGATIAVADRSGGVHLVRLVRKDRALPR